MAGSSVAAEVKACPNNRRMTRGQAGEGNTPDRPRNQRQSDNAIIRETSSCRSGLSDQAGDPDTAGASRPTAPGATSRAV